MEQIDRVAEWWSKSQLAKRQRQGREKEGALGASRSSTEILGGESPRSARDLGSPNRYTKLSQMAGIRARVDRAVREKVAVVPYNSQWRRRFLAEKEHLLRCLPKGSVRRIEHFGSTAVPGLPAKPIVDILVEVSSLRVARTRIAPVLIVQGYEYFWRPTFGDNVPPWYAFFIKRNKRGIRTHHIHVITRRPAFREHWRRLLFVDYLIAHPGVAKRYARLKRELATAHPHDRIAYTSAKAAFISGVMAKINAHNRAKEK